MSAMPDDIMERARTLYAGLWANDSRENLSDHDKREDILEIALTLQAERQRTDDRIEELERQLAEMTEKTIVGEYMWSPAELHVAIISARREALEEAAKIAEAAGRHLRRGDAGIEYVNGNLDIAATIRALSDSSPTPLQEQNANSGKEGE